MCFFAGRRRHTRWPRDWSSDVCSSDLLQLRNSLPGDRGVAEAMSGGVRVRRGGFELLVAFEGGATAKVVASSTLVLCSESDRYQPTPVPPTVAEGAIRFARPGARIYRVDD